MSTEPEALRLAAQLEDTESARLHLLPYAAAALRRLSAVEAQRDALLEALKELMSDEAVEDGMRWADACDKARDAIKQAEGETK